MSHLIYSNFNSDEQDADYLEAAGNYVTFVLGGKRLLSRMTMTEFTDLLPPDQFVCVHRSFVVAKDKIDKLKCH